MIITDNQSFLSEQLREDDMEVMWNKQIRKTIIIVKA